MEEKEPTLKEVNASLNDLTEFLQEHMVTKEEALTKEELKNELSGFATKKDLRQTEHRIMDALDTKLANLKGKLVSLMKKVSKQLDELTVVLQNKRILSKKEAERVLTLAPFPRNDII